METALTFLIYTVAGAIVLWTTLVVIAIIVLLLPHK